MLEVDRQIRWTEEGEYQDDLYQAGREDAAGGLLWQDGGN